MTSAIVILSNIIIDDITLTDATRLPNTLGGAATYAAVAARLWWNPVAIVAGVGKDFAAVTGGVLSDYGLGGDGHLRLGPHTIQSRLTYRADGTRTEMPVHGTDYFASLQVGPERIPASLLPAAGTYVFRDLDTHYWTQIRALRASLGTILWEIQDDGIAGRWDEVAALLPLVQIFSFNLHEGRSLFGDVAPDIMVSKALAAGVGVVVLRMGGEGALVAHGAKRLHVGPPASDVVDVTGGGNAFCGGFLGGWLAGGGDLEFASRRAAAGAAHALGQFGPANPLKHPRALAWADMTSITSV